MSDQRPPYEGGGPDAQDFEQAAKRAEAQVDAKIAASREAAVSEEKAAQKLSGEAKRIRGGRGKMRAAAREFTAAENARIQEYIDAQQLADASSGTDRAAVQRSRTLRDELGTEGILPRTRPAVGQYRPASIPSEASRAGRGFTAGSEAHIRALAKAREESPNFRFTPTPNSPAPYRAVFGDGDAARAAEQKAAEAESKTAKVRTSTAQAVESAAKAEEVNLDDVARYTRERARNGGFIYRDPQGKQIRKSASAEYSHVVVDRKSGEPISFHKTPGAAFKARGDKAAYVEAFDAAEMAGPPPPVPAVDPRAAKVEADVQRRVAAQKARQAAAAQEARQVQVAIGRQAFTYLDDSGLRDESPGLKQALESAKFRGNNVHMRLPEADARAMADQLDSYAGALRQMTPEERSGERPDPYETARDRIDKAVKNPVTASAPAEKAAVDKETRARAKKTAKQNDVATAVGDNADELERESRKIAEEVEQRRRAAEEYDRRAQAGAVPKVGSKEFEARQAEERARAAAQRQAVPDAPDRPPPPPPPRADVIPHPTAFGQRSTSLGYSGRDVQETGDPILRPRGGLAGARAELAQAQAASAASGRALRSAITRADKISEQELLDAQELHATNQQVTAAKRSQVASIERQIADNLEAKNRPTAASPRPGDTGTLYDQPRRGRLGAADTGLVYGPRPPVSARYPQATDTGLLHGPASANQPERAAGFRLNPADSVDPGVPRNAPRTGPYISKDQRRELRNNARQAASAEDELARATQRVAKFEADFEQAAMGAGRGVQYQAAALGASDQTMRRHGALTTEFISSAARGEASYREWGYQIGATAGKFAGWTAVSIPVFAALDGVRRIGEGAIASASGVDKLKRTINDVNPSSAQASFRDLSSQFNVPIADAVEAVSGMGQVFHRQADAVNAARAALFAYKTGGVEVGVATKDLVAIQQGLGASSGDLLDIFDKLNYVQNNYGARIPDLESGVARTAGAFRQAGGSVDELITLMVTLNRQANVTGPQAATIIGRTIGQIRKPQAAAALRGYGVDPTAPIGDVFRQSQAAAQRPGADVRGIAQALGGQYFARQLTPLLLNKDYSDKLLGQLQSGQAKGASQRELNNVLNQLDEQIQKVGANLGRLGSNLAESGFLTGLEVLVGLLNTTLTTVNGILGVFNKLPGPVKTLVAGMLQIRALTGLARRTNIGEGLLGGRFAGAAPYLIESDERRTRRLVGRGQNDEVKYLRNEQENTTKSAFQAAAARDRAYAGYRQEVAGIEKAVAAGAITEEQATVAKAEAAEGVLAANERSLAATRASASALVATQAAEAEQAELAQRLRSAPRSQRNQVAADFAHERGLYVPGRLDTPSTTPLYKIGPDGQLVADEAATAQQEALGQTGQAALRQQEETARQSRRFGTSLRTSFATQAEAFNAARAEAGTARAAGARMAAAGTAVGESARAAAGGAAAGLRNIGTGLLAALGPLDIAIIGFVAGMELLSHHKQAQEQIERDLKQINQVPSNTAELRTQRKYLDDQERKRRSSGGAGLLGDVAHFFDPGDDKHGLFAAVQGRTDVRDPEIAAIEAARKGQPKAPKLLDSISRNVDRDVAAYHAGRITLAQLNEHLDERIQEINASEGSNVKTRRVARRSIQGVRLSESYGRGFYRTLVGQDGNLSQVADAVLDKESQGLTALSGIGQATDTQLEHFAAEQLAIMARTKGAKDPASQQRYASAASALQQGLVGAAQAELQRSLALATTQGQRDAAYARFEHVLGLAGSGEQQTIGAIRRSAARTRRQLAVAQANVLREQAQTLGSGSSPLGPLGNVTGALSGAPDDQLGKAVSARDALRTKLGQQKKNMAALRAVLKVFDDMAAQARKEARDQQQANAAQLAQLRAQVDAHSVAAGVPRAQFLLRAAGQAVQRAIAQYGAGTQEALSAIQQQQQAQDQVATEQASQIQAETEYASSRASNPRGEQDAQASGLRRLIAFYQAHPQQFSKATVLGAMAQLNNLAKQKRQQAEQDAKDLLDARYAYLESLTDDPLSIDRLELEKANKVLARGGFRTKADRYRALADRATAKRKLKDDTADRQLESLDLDAEIGKITAQQQIAGYERVLRTTNLGVEYRRNLKNKILRLKHQLDQEDTLDLNVGDIRLPTVYDVRRLAKTGAGNGRVQQTNHYNIRVDEGTNIEAWGEEFLSVTGQHNRAALRSAGLV